MGDRVCASTTKLKKAFMEGSIYLIHKWQPEIFCWLRFQTNSCYHIAKHFKICYLGTFQHLRVKGCKVMARSNVRHGMGNH